MFPTLTYLSERAYRRRPARPARTHARPLTRLYIYYRIERSASCSISIWIDGGDDDDDEDGDVATNSARVARRLARQRTAAAAVRINRASSIRRPRYDAESAACVGLARAHTDEDVVQRRRRKDDRDNCRAKTAEPRRRA